MIQIPNILKNPESESFNLIESELYSFKEANELIKANQIKYSLFAIWNAIIINLQRRIEDFGIDTFLLILDKKDTFYKNEEIRKTRWIDIDEYKLIDYAKKLRLITFISADLIKSFYWMKSNKIIEDNIQEDEIFAILFLLEKNLFLTDFKIDKRSKSSTANGSLHRRISDKNEEENIIPQTRQEFMLKYGIDVFKEGQEKTKEEKRIISKYG